MPSMSIAPRETKCSSSCQRRPGQARFGQRVKTPSSLTVGVSQTGSSPAARGAGGAVLALDDVRRRRDHLRDHVAGALHDHVVARAHVLARDVLLVVQRRELAPSRRRRAPAPARRTGAARRYCRRSTRRRAASWWPSSAGTSRRSPSAGRARRRRARRCSSKSSTFTTTPSISNVERAAALLPRRGSARPPRVAS